MDGWHGVHAAPCWPGGRSTWRKAPMALPGPPDFRSVWLRLIKWRVVRWESISSQSNKYLDEVLLETRPDDRPVYSYIYEQIHGVDVQRKLFAAATSDVILSCSWIVIKIPPSIPLLFRFDLQNVDFFLSDRVPPKEATSCFTCCYQQAKYLPLVFSSPFQQGEAVLVQLSISSKYGTPD